jgi:Zn ribbon nucleic-acid-binding protein
MRTIKDYFWPIKMFGHPIKARIRVRVEEDPEGRDQLLDCDLGPEREEILEDYDQGRLEVLVIYVLVETDLFKGSDTIGGVFVRSEKDIYDAVKEYCLLEEAIDDLKGDAERYKTFFESLDICPSCDNKGYLEVTQEDNCEYIESCDNCNYFGSKTERDDRAREAAKKDGYMLNPRGRIINQWERGGVLYSRESKKKGTNNE